MTRSMVMSSFETRKRGSAPGTDARSCACRSGTPADRGASGQRAAVETRLDLETVGLLDTAFDERGVIDGRHGPIREAGGTLVRVGRWVAHYPHGGALWRGRVEK